MFTLLFILTLFSAISGTPLQHEFSLIHGNFLALHEVIIDARTILQLSEELAEYQHPLDLIVSLVDSVGTSRNFAQLFSLLRSTGKKKIGLLELERIEMGAEGTREFSLLAATNVVRLGLIEQRNVTELLEVLQSTSNSPLIDITFDTVTMTDRDNEAMIRAFASLDLSALHLRNLKNLPYAALFSLISECKGISLTFDKIPFYSTEVNLFIKYFKESQVEVDFIENRLDPENAAKLIEWSLETGNQIAIEKNYIADDNIIQLVQMDLDCAYSTPINHIIFDCHDLGLTIRGAKEIFERIKFSALRQVSFSFDREITDFELAEFLILIFIESAENNSDCKCVLDFKMAYFTQIDLDAMERVMKSKILPHNLTVILPKVAFYDETIFPADDNGNIFLPFHSIKN